MVKKLRDEKWRAFEELNTIKWGFLIQLIITWWYTIIVYFRVQHQNFSSKLKDLKANTEFLRFIWKKLRAETSLTCGVLRDEMNRSVQLIEDNVGEYVAHISAAISQGCAGCKHLETVQLTCNGKPRGICCNNHIKLVFLFFCKDLRREKSIQWKEKVETEGKLNELLSEIEWDTPWC